MKWYGDIGFREEVEQEPGIVIPKVITKPFYGDVIRDSWKEVQGDKINANLNVSNKLSVVADPYLQNNFHKIAYVTFCGAKWTVSGVEVNFPRLTLDLGSLYLEDEEEDDYDDDETEDED